MGHVPSQVQRSTEQIRPRTCWCTVAPLWLVCVTVKQSVCLCWLLSTCYRSEHRRLFFTFTFPPQSSHQRWGWGGRGRASHSGVGGAGALVWRSGAVPDQPGLDSTRGQQNRWHLFRFKFDLWPCGTEGVPGSGARDESAEGTSEGRRQRHSHRHRWVGQTWAAVCTVDQFRGGFCGSS